MYAKYVEEEDIQPLPVGNCSKYLNIKFQIITENHGSLKEIFPVIIIFTTEIVNGNRSA